MAALVPSPQVSKPGEANMAQFTQLNLQGKPASKAAPNIPSANQRPRFCGKKFSRKQKTAALADSFYREDSGTSRPGRRSRRDGSVETWFAVLGTNGSSRDLNSGSIAGVHFPAEAACADRLRSSARTAGMKVA